jgi:diacylglycerol kinase family enzyme
LIATGAASVTAPDVDPRRVAVLLNVHAKKVTPKVWRALTEALPAEHIYVSSNLQEAWEVAGKVVEGLYGTVLTGGGDGTFMGFVNAVLDQHGIAAHQGRVGPRAPRFGLLKLGTGNAVAIWAGASPATVDGLKRDVARVRAGEDLETVQLDLVIAEGVRAPFAGVGVDAAILNDYAWMRQRLGHGPLRAVATGAMGYTMSIAGRTVPMYAVARQSPLVTIINRGAPALHMSPDGTPYDEKVPAGEVLFSGRAKLVAVSTVPCYGYGFKLFPFADLEPGRMQLRIGDLSVGSILMNLPEMWKGTYQSPQLHDFLVADVEIRSEGPLPFQIGGDAAGYREKVRFTVTPAPLALVKLE